jgi:hypothetical protein
MPCKSDDDEYAIDTVSYDSDDNIYIKADEHNILHSNRNWYDEMKPLIDEIYNLMLDMKDNHPMLENLTYSSLLKFVANNSYRTL